jgi:hypothetical protein
MRLAKIMAALALSLSLWVAPASAGQVPKLQLMAQQQPKIQMQQQRPRQQQVKPRVLLIPPSQAAQIAISQNPGATLLNIKPRGNNYIATMRQGNRVFRVPIPGN